MKVLLISLFFILSTSAFAEISMRKCTLLPITDSVDGVISYKVFSHIEDHLRSSSWCEYTSNSGIINIFDKYRYNLKGHLNNPKVVKLVSQRLNVGSVIRIDIQSAIDSAIVSMQIIGENGEDIYFSEKVKLNSSDLDLINRTIKNWFNVFEKNIPYDGRVNGILGEQLTLNIGEDNNVKVGNEFVIKRPIRKKRHPLLKQIVEWETEILAKGKIFSVSQNQALGMVKVYTKNKKLQNGDWVVVNRSTGVFAKDLKYSDIKANEFGKLGLATITLDLNNSKTNTTVSGTSKEAGGFILGFDLLGEVWITRNYFAMFELARRFGSQSPTTGSFTKSDIGITSGKLKFLGGYKFLPMGYFNGPQIDIYTGKSFYTYEPDKSVADGLGSGEFTGITLGLRGNVPIYKLVRIIARVELLMFSEYEDEANISSGAGDPSTLEVELGVRYSFNPLYTLDLYIERLSNKISFSGTTSEIHYKDTIIKAGLTLKF